MKKLRPIIVPNDLTLKREILALIKKVLFDPLLLEINKSEEIFYNSAVSALRQALLDGRIEYSNGAFKGRFSARISKELRDLGLNFDKRTKSFRKEITKLPIEIQSVIAQATSENDAINQSLLAKLSNFPINQQEINDANLSSSFAQSITTIDKKFATNISMQLEISINLTEAQKAIIAKEYSNNLKLYIRKFIDEEVLKLRSEVEQSVQAGYRAEHLKELIKKRYNVSDSKARFLALQETSLLTSKYTELRYKDAGITKYEWSTSHDVRVRDSHAVLNGKIFSFDDPPVVDDKGNKANPGEPFGCRCVAIPLI